MDCAPRCIRGEWICSHRLFHAPSVDTLLSRFRQKNQYLATISTHSAPIATAATAAAAAAAATPMGRDKSLRNTRRSRPASNLPIPHPAGPPPPVAASSDVDPNTAATDDPSLDLNPISTPNPNPSAGPSDEGWCYYTEEQLEEVLLKNLDIVYKKAVARLLSLGYDEPFAIRAILSNGHCYGSVDALSNILHNTLSFINASPPPSDVAPFANLHRLADYSLSCMICFVQQVRPQLSRGDALWCLLMSDLHVGRACMMNIPCPCSPHRPSQKPLRKRNAPKLKSPPPPAVPASAPALCRLQTSAMVCAPRYPGPPSTLKPLLKHMPSESPDTLTRSLEGMSIADENAPPESSETEEDPKKERIFDLIYQIKELEIQVKERREWAQHKALQAAQKLSTDLAELKLLRAERELNQQAWKEVLVQDDSGIKRLSEMEATLKEANEQLVRTNMAVDLLELENANIRAEIAASKLSAAESTKACNEMVKRENKRLKQLLAREKQRVKMEEDIAEERRKISVLEKELTQVQETQKETEIKWRHETKAKEEAIALAEMERKAKESVTINIKREHEALHQKIELDFQRHKDDVRRLEGELSRLKASARSNTLVSAETDVSKILKVSSQMMDNKRKCIICKQKEVSVVFLPCAHQVVCGRCNEDHEKRAKSSCPCCSVKIEERICVYGTSF